MVRSILPKPIDPRPIPHQIHELQFHMLSVQGVRAFIVADDFVQRTDEGIEGIGNRLQPPARGVLQHCRRWIAQRFDGQEQRMRSAGSALRLAAPA